MHPVACVVSDPSVESPGSIIESLGGRWNSLTHADQVSPSVPSYQFRILGTERGQYNIFSYEASGRVWVTPRTMIGAHRIGLCFI